MSALEIEFHCLCVFVPDPQNKRVHVLMPATGGEGADGDPPHEPAAGGGGDGHPHDHPGGAAGAHGHVHERHIVRIVHDDLDCPVDMEGWALRLGRARRPIELDLVPRYPENDAELIDLNRHTTRRLDPTLLRERADKRLIARVTLREGYMLSANADAKWLMKGQPIYLANRAVWRIDDFRGGPLDWKRLTAKGDEPLGTFDNLSAPDDVRHVHIFHTTQKGLAGDVTILTEEEVREHFRVVLELYGIRRKDDPRDLLLPKLDKKEAGRVDLNCPVTKGAAG
jgi:hypothetical protein